MNFNVGVKSRYPEKANGISNWLETVQHDTSCVSCLGLLLEPMILFGLLSYHILFVLNSA